MVEQGTKVGSFIWPFFRYDVLMPQQVRTDLFEWLYLSLVVQQNDLRSLDKNSYTKEVKDEVRRIIKQRFSSLLDETTIDNIIVTAEKDFTVKDESQRGSNEYLREDVFSFLNTYEDLFCSQVTVQRIFQDAICNGVVPCFKENDYVKDAKTDGQFIIKALVKEKPTQEQIKKAYSLFNRLNNLDGRQDDIPEEDEFYDPDAEVDFEPDFDGIEQKPVAEKKQQKTNFSAHFIDNSKCEFNLEIPVYTDGEKLYVGTPFDANTTMKWFNKRLAKARSVCEGLDKYLQELEMKYTLKKDETDNTVTHSFVYHKGVADQLTYCGEIYRMIEHLPEQYNDLKKLLIDVDKQFTSKHKSYFNSLGGYLECLLHPFIDHTDCDSRQYFDYSQYCASLNYVCSQVNVNSRPLLSENIFKNWLKGWDHFKADIANLFISNTKMHSNPKLYYEFIQDVFDLYDSRNNGSHYKPGMTYQYNDADIEKLARVTRVFIELI